MKKSSIVIENFLNNFLDNINPDDFDLESFPLPGDLFLPKAPAFSENLFKDKTNIKGINYLLQQDMRSFQEYILKMNYDYDEARIKMNNFEFKNLNKIIGDEKDRYVIKVIQIFQNTCYYLNDDIRRFFNKINFDGELMHWFISLESILIEFNKIIERGKIIFPQGTALMSLDTYLKMRIKQEVDIWVGNTNPRYTDVTKANNTFITAKKILKKNGQIDFDDEHTNQNLEFLSNMFGQVQNTRNILSFFRGDTAKFSLGMLITSSEMMTNIKNGTKFYAEFFDLFRLIIGKKSDNDILGYIMLKKRQYCQQYPNRNYDTYKGKRIRDIFTRDK